jgi:hypothetical protein
MSTPLTDPFRFLAGGQQSLLERTLIAEYLLCKGYLLSELNGLPPQVAKSLMREARRFAALKLAEIDRKSEFSQKFRLQISLN